ncbi:MAG TPA: polysaccharide pyruvyl transferase family protein [Ruminococcaceae bacterium]|nr:polysaccharide pyruvyl transferase family protein [Oscillospiraceae bacterium]
MKKLGICVCYQHRNYGSQLQSFATTVELEKRGIDYEIIRYKKKLTPSLAAKMLPKLFNPVFISDRVKIRYKKNLMMKTHPQLGRDNAVRNECLAKFSREHFTKLSPVYEGYSALKSGAEKYSAVMVGSDQLWAPGGITSDFYNLMFAPEGVERLSYAASFGVSKIEPKLHAKYREFLSRMDYISVRENAGKKLVEELSGKSAEVVVDPVMLLTAEEWLEQIPDENRFNEPYIFAYLLGDSEEYRRQITEFAKKKGLKIITSHHMDTYNKADEGFGDEAPFDVGPAEFVNFIRNAEYVFTDSFHGSVFSMLYKKQFLIFDRYKADTLTSKNSRIESFCENYGLSDRRFNGDIYAADNAIDFDAVYKKTDAHIKKSKAFLDKALADLE